jgi:hypothetical protein
VTCATTAVVLACATARVERLLRARLDARHLSYRWVVCSPERGVFRCNVDFGDPHIVRYCAVVRGGRLVTDREDARLTCTPPGHPREKFG